MFVIVDGISTGTFEDLSLSKKKVKKYYDRMVAAGDILPKKNSSYSEPVNCGSKRKIQEESGGDGAKKLRVDESLELSDGAGEENLGQTVALWLSKLTQQRYNCIEVIAPSLYGHTALEDLFTLRSVSDLIDGKLHFISGIFLYIFEV